MGIVVAIILIIIFIEPIIEALICLFLLLVAIPIFYFNELINPSYKLLPSIFVGFVNAMLCFSVYALLYSFGVRIHHLIGLAGVLFIIPIIKALKYKPKEFEEPKETKEEEQNTQNTMLDYYKILEINSNAKLEDIKKAYKKQALKYHPDTNCGDKETEELLKQIVLAYETLSNEEKRKAYDINYYKIYNQCNYKNKIKTSKNLDKEFLHILKALIITLVFMAIVFFLTKDFIDL